MSSILSDAGMDLIFREARTHNAWQDKAVPEVTLRAVYHLMRYGPTSANGSPARLKFLVSDEAKIRLKPALSDGNMAKTMAAPVCCIVAYDTQFNELLPQLFPHEPDAKSWFDNPKNRETTAFRNGTLQGAYLIIACRALGLDCGPMSGFDNAKLDAEFFPDGRLKSNFLCNIGFGDPAGLFDRSPRLEFEEACEIL
ncbi:MAG: malonic semialdehyde reductase [Minwuia sp.]|uniref:malonic semialdehyde reductase n=1 Tax=Minwuia sp. TaxID=2493630 RepID=UPI003A88F053